MSVTNDKSTSDPWAYPDSIRGVATAQLVSRVSVRIPYSHTDIMGIVNHARYFEYFEAARESYVRRRKLPVDEIIASGHGLPLSGAHFQFEKAARYGDEVTVEARVVHLNRARLRFQYRISVGDAHDGCADDVLVRGWTDHVFTDSQLNLRPFPKSLMDGLLGPEIASEIIPGAV